GTIFQMFIDRHGSSPVDTVAESPVPGECYTHTLRASYVCAALLYRRLARWRLAPGCTVVSAGSFRGDPMKPPISTIIAVLATVAPALVAGRSSVPQSFDNVAFDGCLASVGLEYRRKIAAEFRQIEKVWLAQHDRYQPPALAAVFRTIEPLDLEGYMARVSVTREDYPAYIERRI